MSINLTIDGQTTTVSAGTTIWQVSQSRFTIAMNSIASPTNPFDDQSEADLGD